MTTLDGDSHKQLDQEIVQRLNSLAQSLEVWDIASQGYRELFNTIQRAVEPLVKLGQLRFMPDDLIHLLDPTWEMPQLRQLSHLLEKLENGGSMFKLHQFVVSFH